MSGKKLLALVVIVGLMVAFSIQSAIASDPKWQEKQQAMFEKTGLKPGDIIDKSDWRKVDGLLPELVMRWLKSGKLAPLKIAEFKYDAEADDEWINAGRKNVGKYKLDAKKNLVDAATGKPSLWVYGIPFPNLDIKNDPDAPPKFMYNQLVSVRRMGSARQPFQLQWVGQKGFERDLDGFWERYYYWARPDGQQRNPSKRRYLDITRVIEPYDVAGTAQLTLRRLDGSEDELYVYVPAIRRVKKMSGANRSDPYMGADASVDDGDGWAGLTRSMKWTIIEEKVGLFHTLDWVPEHTDKMKRLPNGTWRTPADEDGVRFGWTEKGWGHAPWAPVNVAWVPREFILIEGMPLDPYYNYGRTLYWIDKGSYWINYKTIWDKAGELWKGIMYLPRCMEWGDKRGVQVGVAGYTIWDEKMSHATTVISSGRHKGREYYMEFMNPKLNPRMFTVEKLRMLSK